MPLARVASTSPLLQRACLRCGYRGLELQRLDETAAYRCPACGQDLYARPPRSYAEMEGLPVALPAPERPSPAAARPLIGEGRRARRSWLGRFFDALVARIGLRTRRRAASAVSAPSPQARLGRRPNAPRA
jgi:predicted RNA-binding Zn-ribbon protein involved in translation (DUF1610 family)